MAIHIFNVIQAKHLVINLFMYKENQPICRNQINNNLKLFIQIIYEPKPKKRSMSN